MTSVCLHRHLEEASLYGGSGERLLEEGSADDGTVLFVVVPHRKRFRRLDVEDEARSLAGEPRRWPYCPVIPSGSVQTARSEKLGRCVVKTDLRSRPADSKCFCLRPLL